MGKYGERPATENCCRPLSGYFQHVKLGRCPREEENPSPAKRASHTLPESPLESPSETPHEPQPDPSRNHPARTRTRPPGCPKSRSSEAQSAFCNALGGVELADGYFSDRLPLRKTRATHTRDRESPPNCYFPAMASISTRAPLGRAATW